MRYPGITKDVTDEFFEKPALSFASQNDLHGLFDRILDSEQEFVLILGAGVSLDAGFPSWSGLISNIIETSFLDEKWKSTADGDRADLLRKAETVIQIGLDYTSSAKEEIVRTALYRSSNNSSVSKVIPGRLADAIARLFFLLRGRVGIVTANYDTIIESAINRYADEADLPRVGPVAFDPDRHVTVEGLWDIWNRESEILHIHGILEPNAAPAGNLVLTESDYLEYGSRIIDFIEALISGETRNVIFIGVSLTDPNLVAPLWRIKKKSASDDVDAQLTEEAIPRQICAFSVVSPAGSGDREDIDKAESYEVRKALSLSNLLGVSMVLLKSYGQQIQLINEMSFALDAMRENGDNAQRYIDSSDPEESIRYGFRLRRTLDRCYQNLGCGDRDEFPIKDAAAQLSNRLHQYLTHVAENSIIDLLTTARGKIQNSHAKEQRDVFTDFSGAFERERFGIFLWLRSRSGSENRAAYDLRLIGTSVYQHREDWSLDRVAAVTSNSRFPVARASYFGNVELTNIPSNADWQLWNSILAVPFAVESPGSVLGADILDIGVVSLNSTAYAFPGESGWKRGDNRSVLSAMFTEDLEMLIKRLETIGEDVVSNPLKCVAGQPQQSSGEPG